MARPPVDLVVPFRGGRPELEELRARLARVRLRPGDTILVVDNTPGGEPRLIDGQVPVLRASGRTTPGYARNRGAARGSAPWLVFIDADTLPREDLLDRYFDPPPAPDTVLLAGEVLDEPVPSDASGPARYAYLRNTLSQTRSLSFGRWSFVQSTNLACRRSAFDAASGFHETIIAAEDADLSYRLKAYGGGIERREAATVIHRSRQALRPFIAQAAKYGAGAAWLNRHYPGSFPRRRRPGMIWWAIRFAATGCWRAVRRRDHDELVLGLYEPLWELAFEFGRSMSIDWPTKRRRR